MSTSRSNRMLPSIYDRISHPLSDGVTGCLGCLQSLNLLLMWDGIHWVANTKTPFEKSRGSIKGIWQRMTMVQLSVHTCVWMSTGTTGSQDVVAYPRSMDKVVMGSWIMRKVVEKKRKTECDIQIVHIERESALAYAVKTRAKGQVSSQWLHTVSAPGFPHALPQASLPHSFWS